MDGKKCECGEILIESAFSKVCPVCGLIAYDLSILTHIQYQNHPHHNVFSDRIIGNSDEQLHFSKRLLKLQQITDLQFKYVNRWIALLKRDFCRAYPQLTPIQDQIAYKFKDMRGEEGIINNNWAMAYAIMWVAQKFRVDFNTHHLTDLFDKFHLTIDIRAFKRLLMTEHIISHTARGFYDYLQIHKRKITPKYPQFDETRLSPLELLNIGDPKICSGVYVVLCCPIGLRRKVASKLNLSPKIVSTYIQKFQQQEVI